MKRLLTLFSVLLVAFFLTGCLRTVEKVVVTEKTTVVLTTPKTYTTPTPVPKPPYTQEMFLSADWPTRSQWNGELSATLYKSLNQCNADKVSAIQWETTEKAKLEKTKKEAK